MPEGTETATQTPEAPQEGQGQQREQEQQNLDALPEWARTSLKKANDEAARYRTRVRELEPKAAELDKMTEAQKTEAQKTAEARAAAEERAVKAESEAARLRIALTKNLPVELASRLVGSTEEELAADADRLLQLVQAPTQTPSFDGGVRTTATEPDMNAAIRRAAGR